MKRYAIISIALLLCILSVTQGQAQSDTNINNKNDAPTINVTKLDVNDKTLELRYEIKNGTPQDIWVCENIDVYNSWYDFDVHMTKDCQTLLIRRRFDVPLMNILRNAARGRYIRMRPGHKWTESLLLPLPVRQQSVFWATLHKNEYANHLAIEIGFYPGDLYGLVLGMLEEKKKATLFFTRTNERERDRDEQISFYWQPYREISGEQVLRTEVTDINVPYDVNAPSIPSSPADLKRCTRIEINYQPSMLEYFFPYEGQQELLNVDEKKYLQSQKKIVVDDKERIEAFAGEISEGSGGFGIMIATERSTAQVVCYENDEPFTSFTAYDYAIESEGKQRFKYQKDLPNIMMRTLMPQIKPFELRVRCANNLKNLWHRFRLYYKAKDIKPPAISLTRSMMVCPIPAVWCDALVEAYLTTGRKYTLIEPYRCPSSIEGECHYAMNSNCTTISPPDMVLLFETKAGWNQHGGPELFTFTNHDPKGGCVLLKDGTVKFIRTREELNQLRWK